mgnify:CR=1 FL=1
MLDGLITNFHLPESTLVMLVSALAGRENVLAAYKEAVDNQYVKRKQHHNQQCRFDLKK